MLGPQKAQVGAIISIIGIVLTGVLTAIPDGTTAKVIIVTAGTIVTGISNYLGIYNTTNKPETPPAV